MKRVVSVVDRARKFSLDADAHYEPTNNLEDSLELPAWGAIRQKVFSFIRSRSRSPGNKSPGSKSPGSKSPTGSKSPFSVSPNSRSPSKRSPTSRSPTRRSPSLRSPTTGSPSRTPSCTPPLYSPSGSKPFVPASSRRTSFSKSSRESRSSSSDNESHIQSQRRMSVKPQKRVLNLNIGGSEGTESLEGRPGTPVTACPCASTPITKGKTKFRNRLDGEVLDLDQMNDDLSFVEAARRPRKWSYHGTASPSAQVEAPKRHSFSTVSDHKTGIVVTNNDLATLLGQNKLLLPGLPICDVAPLPTLPNPKARGRSQSIAACAQSVKPFGKARPDEPIAPVVIRTTDCDHLPSIQSHDSVDSQKDEEEENLLWDSSGSKVDVNLLGSVIETYLKTSTQEEEEEKLNETETITEETEPDGSPSLLTPFKGLQVK